MLTSNCNSFVLYLCIKKQITVHRDEVIFEHCIIQVWYDYFQKLLVHGNITFPLLFKPKSLNNIYGRDYCAIGLEIEWFLPNKEVNQFQDH